MRNARDSILHDAEAPDADADTLHIRCGSDLRSSLENAGFVAAFLEYADPLCLKPARHALATMQTIVLIVRSTDRAMRLEG